MDRSGRNRWKTLVPPPSAAGAVLACCLACATAVAADASRPNVLLIVSDDLNNCLGCYGDTVARTPHIDRLATAGVRFDRACCQLPLCNPSRTSMLTGRRPDSLGVHFNHEKVRELFPDIVTLPQLFRKNGYFVARVGKIFHYGVPWDIGTPGLDDPESWDLALYPRGRDRDDEHLLINYTPATQLGAAMAWMEARGADDEQTDAKVAAGALRLLEEHGDRPFFLAVGFYRPHVPCVATPRWFEPISLQAVRLFAGSERDLESVPPAAVTVRPPNYGLDEADLRAFKRAYYASVSFMDHQVGRLLDALNRLKLADRTIVVFLSDNGFLLGQHGQWQKMSLFEESARVPLIIAAPGTRARGQASPVPVELLDVYPTLAGLCGLDPPVGLEGRSLQGLLDDPGAGLDEAAAWTQVVRHEGQQRYFGRSVRTARWRYVEWDDGRRGLQLYDHLNDPGEHRNLAGDPVHAGTVAELAARLRQGFPQAGPPARP